MPLPADQRLVTLGQSIIKQFDMLFGLHPGFRPAHAKGVMLTGNFTPSSGARSLTRAPHMVRPSTPVTVRFSDSTGVPVIPDNDANASPRGSAIRFHLAEHSHTDIVSHSTNGFPARTGDDFLELLQAIAASDPSRPSDPKKPSPIEMFLGSHPAALAYVQAPKPLPSSLRGKVILRSRLTTSSMKMGKLSLDDIESPPWPEMNFWIQRQPRRRPPTIYSTN